MQSPVQPHFPLARAPQHARQSRSCCSPVRHIPADPRSRGFLTRIRPLGLITIKGLSHASEPVRAIYLRSVVRIEEKKNVLQVHHSVQSELKAEMKNEGLTTIDIQLRPAAKKS